MSAIGNPPGCDSPVPASRIGDICRCIVCSRCGRHTGNSHQGHYWSHCDVTGTMRGFHLCCPGNCELENPTVVAWTPTRERVMGHAQRNGITTAEWQATTAQSANLLGAAQVHATLALAAATAIPIDTWFKVAGPTEESSDAG